MTERFMKSRASIKSHPIHPILIPFPIAFFTGTVVTHVAGWIREDPTLLQMAFLLNMAGIVSAVLAAVPGIIDFTYTVPPDSSAKKRAAKHGLLNTMMLLLLSFAAYYRRNEDHQPLLLLAIELTGLILMLIAGWMGGTLVHRNQIGVDHRYAHAGKWNETSLKHNSGTLEVAAADELKVNAMKLLHINGQRIVLARNEDGYSAFDDRCTHKGGSLADGSLICGTVQCPWHGSQFSVKDGKPTAGPATASIKTYPVELREGKVFLRF
jgi:nitrite reductase/ring-hydroxylating ferredoxin subunit/uncharacterized membrane protein